MCNPTPPFVNKDNKSNKKESRDDENNHAQAAADDAEVVDVVIIGAGFAGLAAAKELSQQCANISVKILEGRNEIGGRCRTRVLDDGVSVAELGAQWIHGAKAKVNPVYDAALESGMELARSEYSSQIAYIQNNDNDSKVSVVSEEKLEEMTEKIMDGKKGFFRYQERRQDNDVNDISLRQCADEYLAKIKATPEERQFLNFLLDSNMSQEYAGSLEDMSMFWWDSDVDIKGGDVHVPQKAQDRGFQGLIEHFAKDILQRNWVEYHSKVTDIDWSSSEQEEVVVHYTQQGEAKIIAAKQVLVTVPIGVLQAKSIAFTPALPKAKQRAIDSIGNGLYNKCVFLWDEQDADQLPWPNDKEWLEKIVSPNSQDPQGLWTEFFNSTPVNGRPMLCGFSAGRIAQEMEQCTEQQIQDSAMQALQTLYPEATIPCPRQVVITKWGQDEFARGSYSFNALGGKHSGRKQLAAPLEQKLYFAGEACHSQYFGTTHGALMSGVTAAKQVLKHSAHNDINFNGSLSDLAKAAAKKKPLTAPSRYSSMEHMIAI